MGTQVEVGAPVSPRKSAGAIATASRAFGYGPVSYAALAAMAATCSQPLAAAPE